MRPKHSSKSGKGADEYENYQACPNITVRDYAYSSSDPRHYGLPASQSRTSSQSFSDSNLDSDFRAENRSEGGEIVKRYEVASAVAVEGHILPRIANELRSHMGGIELGFYKVKAMFDFQKATDWEMSIQEHDEIYVAYLKPYNSSESLKSQSSSKASIGEADKEKDGKEASNNKIAMPTDELPQDQVKEGELLTDDGEDQARKQNPQATYKTDERENRDTEPQSATTPAITSPTKSGLSDRWASIDEISAQQDKKSNTMRDGASPSQSIIDGAELDLKYEPLIADIASQLNQLLDYAGLYGAGWVSALQFKIRAKIVNSENAMQMSPDAETPTTTEAKKCKTKVTMLALGLVPGNYIEKVELKRS